MHQQGRCKRDLFIVGVALVAASLSGVASAAEPGEFMILMDSDRAIAEGRPVMVDILLFDYDGTKLTEQSNTTLEWIARHLAEQPAIKAVVIRGHADPRGKGEYNQSLSENRAESVAAALRQYGTTQPLTVVGMGATLPICQGSSERAQLANRRVELILLPAGVDADDVVAMRFGKASDFVKDCGEATSENCAYAICDRACVDTMSSEEHCGGCGQSCNGVCQDGKCCAAVCGGECCDILTDNQHCGGCGKVCTGGQCAGGQCCEQTVCDGACVDVATSLDHCGGCNQACDGVCNAGQCERAPATLVEVDDGLSTMQQWGLASLGTGVAFFAAGFGAYYYGSADYNDVVIHQREYTQASADREFDDADTLNAWGTAGMVVGGVFALTGASLLYLGDETDEARPWTWGFMGSGLALVGTGLGLYLAADSDYKDFLIHADDFTQIEATDRRDSNSVLYTASMVTMGTGAGLLVTSVVLLLAADDAIETQPLVSYEPDQDQLLLGIRGTF